MQPRNRSRHSPLRGDSSFELSSPTSRHPASSPGDGHMSFLRGISVSPIARNHAGMHSILSDPPDSPPHMNSYTPRTRPDFSLLTDSNSILSNRLIGSPVRTPRGLLQEVSYRVDYSREDRLRILRHDAAQQHLNKAATFFAEKLTALSGK